MSKRKNLTISKGMSPAYREYLRGKRRSGATVEKYLRDMGVFLEYVGENRVLGREKIREYKEELQEEYKIPNANSMLTVVSSFLVFLERGEPKMKLFRMQEVLYGRPEREMTERDYEKLVRTARQCRDLGMNMLLQTIGSTGARISELRLIIVESLEAERMEIYNKGKSWVVPLLVGLSRVLKRYYREAGTLTGSIFVTKHGNLVDRNDVGKKMRQLAREAGVDENRVFPHNSRHLSARIFYSVGKDIARLTDLLGHTSISTIRIYIMITEDQPRRQTSRVRMVPG